VGGVEPAPGGNARSVPETRASDPSDGRAQRRVLQLQGNHGDEGGEQGVAEQHAEGGTRVDHDDAATRRRWRPAREVQEFAGHKSPRTTGRYAHSRASLDRHAAYAVAAHLARCGAGLSAQRADLLGGMGCSGTIVQIGTPTPTDSPTATNKLDAPRCSCPKHGTRTCRSPAGGSALEGGGHVDGARVSRCAGQARVALRVPHLGHRWRSGGCGVLHAQPGHDSVVLVVRVAA
jgi:hypothetical protein